MELRGAVEITPGAVYLVVNPECKCRRSYRVFPESTARELLKEAGRRRGAPFIVKVLGWLTETSPWSGYIYVKQWQEEK